MFFEMSRVEKFILETVHFTWMVSASQRVIILVQSLHDHLFEKEKKYQDFSQLAGIRNTYNQRSGVTVKN